MTATPATISDYVNQLIRPRTHTVTIPDGTGKTKTHTTTHPALLDELENNTTTAKVGVEKVHGDARSKPAGRLDAVALLGRIDREADKVAQRIGSKRVGTLRVRLSSIAGTSADADEETTSWVRSKVQGWVVAAKVITGWDVVPFTPDVPCPYEDCERRGGVKIRVEDQVAYCTECGTTWGPHDIQQLGTYVAWASEHLRGARHWLVDAEGYPVECTECLETRQQMAARATSRRIVA